MQNQTIIGRYQSTFFRCSKFLHGFLSGAVSSMGNYAMDVMNMGNFGNLIASSAIGGTAEAVGGGNFANGAVTGAYTTLFNYMMHQHKQNVAHNNLNKLVKVDSREDLVKQMRSLSEQYQVEIGGIELNVNGASEYYILPAHGRMAGFEYDNDIITSHFNSRYYPEGELVATYHTHLSNNGPSMVDSRTAWMQGTNTNNYVLNNSSVYWTEPVKMPKTAQYHYGEYLAPLNEWVNGNFTNIKH